MKYTDKELKIIKQCNEGPFHIIVTPLTNHEFDILIDKLIEDDSDIFASLVSIYTSYNRNKIIDYLIKKGDVELLLGFLDYCNDFNEPNNLLDEKYIVDKMLEKNDVNFIKEILDDGTLYFLTNNNEKERLKNFIE